MMVDRKENNTKKKIVIALGGNALGNTAKEQLSLVEDSAKAIVDLVEQGNDIIISHGNGPQVGMINLGLNASFEKGIINGEVPFPECGAMSQGYIGYHLQNSIGNELSARNINRDVATVVTQVLVYEDDISFRNPTKPIGSFYDKDTADRIMKDKGYDFVEDSGRGFRRVVPSPYPVDIIEKGIIKNLLDNGKIVIAAGGGGIPVVKKNGKLIGVDAVIDKDLASAKLAEIVEADLFVILTAIDKVKINFGKFNEKSLDRMTIDEAEMYINEDQFAKGSMLPKVKSCIEFVKGGGMAIIADLRQAKEAFLGEAGTCIVK